MKHFFAFSFFMLIIVGIAHAINGQAAIGGVLIVVGTIGFFAF